MTFIQEPMRKFLYGVFLFSKCTLAFIVAIFLLFEPRVLETRGAKECKKRDGKFSYFSYGQGTKNRAFNHAILQIMLSERSENT